MDERRSTTFYDVCYIMLLHMRIQLKYQGVCIRSILVILYLYHNKSKQLVGDKIIYSKPLRKYTMKNVYERTDTDF